MRDPVEKIDCGSADELLDRLHPRKGDWGHFEAEGWVYRGHGDPTWELVPSAFRKESWRSYTREGVDAHPDDVEDLERALAAAFYLQLDRAGMPIPNGPLLVDRARSYFKRGEYDGASWPDEDVEQLLALAQHNGLPTRLLDWTTSRKTAAYFAAVEALKTSSSSLDVWALNTHFIEAYGATCKELRCRIVRTLRHGNPNLHAQAGLFTVCQGRQLGYGSRFTPLDELVRRVATQLPSPPEPCLKRFRLPFAHAHALVRELHEDGIDGLTMFPGYLGVVQALKERRWWIRR